LAVFAGPQAVGTVGAVARYRLWKDEHPRTAHDFLDASNFAVRNLVASRSPGDFFEAWDQTRTLGMELGRQIGSDAVLDAPGSLEPAPFVKALGAGNETGIAAFPQGLPSSLPPGLTPLILSREGLRWE